jgi:hypothetical protein
MCECGCVSSDLHYKFPGHGDSIYILTLSKGCIGCDAPSGVTIQNTRPGDSLYEWYRDPETHEGELHFENWGDQGMGAAIITGMLRSEFIKSTRDHLIGINPKDFAYNDGLIDGDGADVILEEMYSDAQTKPRIVTSVQHGTDT